jgi:hypothetical protein
MRNDTKQLPLSVTSLTSPDFQELARCIDVGLADVAAGRVRDFDIDRIVERGRNLVTRPAAALPKLGDDTP